MSTLNDHRHAADICREHGWKAGTLLVGDEGFGPTVIQVLYVGEKVVLAKQISHDGEPSRWNDEHSWCLSCRDWREVQA